MITISAAMPVPLPGPDTLVLTRPDADEVAAAARGVASAAAPSTGLTDLQRLLIESIFRAMTGHPVDLRSFTPMSPEEFATLMARRDLAFRSRMVQAMLTPALVLRPLPEGHKYTFPALVGPRDIKGRAPAPAIPGE